MATERIKFSRDFDYTWPSRAVTAYPNNWEGPVKREVAAAAVAAGAARRVKLVDEPSDTSKPKRAPRKGRRRRKKTVGIKGGKIDQAQPVETLPRNLPGDLAEPQALTPNMHVDETDNSQ